MHVLRGSPFCAKGRPSMKMQSSEVGTIPYLMDLINSLSENNFWKIWSIGVTRDTCQNEDLVRRDWSLLIDTRICKNAQVWLWRTSYRRDWNLLTNFSVKHGSKLQLIKCKGWFSQNRLSFHIWISTLKP